MANFNYCPQCGAGLLHHVVAGESRNHWYCPQCRTPRYDHAMIVVTCFVACGSKLLWIQRELEPQRGLWAIPGGFLENNETLAAGAARELHEEAGIELQPDQLELYMTGTITFINQVYVAFRATVDTENCRPGVESRSCGFYSRADCPWSDVAYPQVNDSIVQAYDDLESGSFDVWQAQMTSSHYEFLPVSRSPAGATQYPK
jgi:ADP-ribose pyrophosphatase YjhB (NUDIX family)